MTDKETTDAHWRLGIYPSDTRKSYMDRESNINTYAVLLNGEWYSRDSIGWWSNSLVRDFSDKKWSTEWERLFLSLDDETLVSIFDCHN